MYFKASRKIQKQNIECVKSPIRYCGSKGSKSIREKILQQFPSNFKTYREPFCGSASIFFCVPNSIERYIADLDDRLIGIFVELRDNFNFFVSECRKIKPHIEGEELTSSRPGGRKIHNKRLKDFFDYCIVNLDNVDEYSQLYYFYLLRMNWAGRIRLDLSSRMYFASHKHWNVVFTDVMEKASEKLQDTIIRWANYDEALFRDGNDVFIYCDPPYFSNTNMSNQDKQYRYNFEKQDHIQFSNDVKNSKHKILISYDDCEFIRNLYKDFIIIEEEWTYRGNSNRPKGKEILIRNYDAI